MGGWPRGHRRSADINEIGFSGPFFHAAPRNSDETAGNGATRRLRPLPENPAGCHPVQPIPRPRQLSDPIRGGCRPARRALAARMAQGHADSGFRLPGRRRSASGQPPARVAGRRPAFTCHRAAPRKPGDGRAPAGRRAAAVPAYLAGALAGSPPGEPGRPGKAASLPAATACGKRPGWCASARHRGRARHPRFPRPAYRQAGWTGAGAYRSPCTSRVPAADRSGTWPRNGRPAADLTPPRPALAGPGQDRDAVCPGEVTAGSASGQRQVCARSAGGRPGGHRRSAPGQWRLAAWACAPVRYP